MTPEILTVIFLQKESNYSLRNSTALQRRSIKIDKIDQNLAWDRKYGTFYQQN